jgi:hypothetical protein
VGGCVGVSSLPLLALAMIQWTSLLVFPTLSY